MGVSVFVIQVKKRLSSQQALANFERAQHLQRFCAAARYAHLRGIEQHGDHDVSARQNREVDDRLLAHAGHRLLPKGIGHAVVERELSAIVKNQTFIALHAAGALALLQIAHDRIGQARFARNGLVGPPLVLRIRDARLDQDGEFVQAFVDRGLETQIIQKVKGTPGHLWAAQQRVVRATQSGTRDFEDVIGQGPHFSRQIVVAYLGQSFGHGAS